VAREEPRAAARLSREEREERGPHVVVGDVERARARGHAVEALLVAREARAVGRGRGLEAVVVGDARLAVLGREDAAAVAEAGALARDLPGRVGRGLAPGDGRVAEALERRRAVDEEDVRGRAVLAVRVPRGRPPRRVAPAVQAVVGVPRALTAVVGRRVERLALRPAPQPVQRVGAEARAQPEGAGAPQRHAAPVHPRAPAVGHPLRRSVRWKNKKSLN